MDRLYLLFTLAPVLRGFIAIIISGAAFPLCGVMVLRLNLVPMRYMLMHGVILGGAIALVLQVSVVPVSLAVNILLIFIMLFFTKGQTFGFSGASAAVMVLSMAVSSILMHVADVPAKDTLNLLWGSPYALKNYEVVVLFLLALLLVLYIVLNFRNILCIFYNREIATALGIKVSFHYGIMVLIIAFVVAVAMKLLGAFLIDALLLLPVLTGAAVLKNHRGGIKKLFLVSMLSGLIFAVSGYVLAVIVDWPPSATISAVAVIFYIFALILNKISGVKNEN